MRLPFTMVGILTDDYHFYLIERSEVKCVENKRARGIDFFPLLLFVEDALFDSWEIGLFELTLQNLSPAIFDLNSHLCEKKVIPKGFEPLTHSLEGCCSIQLSYGTNRNIFEKRLRI